MDHPVLRLPQHDHGYDVAEYRDIDPRFGTLADADALRGAPRTRAQGDRRPGAQPHLRRHPWFTAALASPAHSPERARYLFVDTDPEHPDEPPNNWPSVFGGSAWTREIRPDGEPGQWYLHLFDSSQPDLTGATRRSATSSSRS